MRQRQRLRPTRPFRSRRPDAPPGPSTPGVRIRHLLPLRSLLCLFIRSYVHRCSGPRSPLPSSLPFCLSPRFSGVVGVILFVVISRLLGYLLYFHFCVSFVLSLSYFLSVSLPFCLLACLPVCLSVCLSVLSVCLPGIAGN